MDLVAGLKHGSGSRSVVRNELFQHSKPDLVVLCEDKNLATRGTKKELVKRMVEYHFSPAPTPTAASESLPVNDNDDDDDNDDRVHKYPPWTSSSGTRKRNCEMA